MGTLTRFNLMHCVAVGVCTCVLLVCVLYFVCAQSETLLICVFGVLFGVLFGGINHC